MDYTPKVMWGYICPSHFGYKYWPFFFKPLYRFARRILAGAAAEGATQVTLDGGTAGDVIEKGDIVGFAGTTGFYEVEEGIQDVGGILTLATPLQEAVANNAGVTVPVFVEIGDFFADGFEPGHEEVSRVWISDVKGTGRCKRNNE